VTRDNIVGADLLSSSYAHCCLRMQHQEKLMLLTRVWHFLSKPRMEFRVLVILFVTHFLLYVPRRFGRNVIHKKQKYSHSSLRIRVVTSMKFGNSLWASLVISIRLSFSIVYVVSLSPRKIVVVIMVSDGRTGCLCVYQRTARI
jgi:hypothetical protein